MSPFESDLLLKLLEPDFPGRNELLLQATGVQVRTVIEYKDDYGSFEFEGQPPPLHRVPTYQPVNARAHDEDGVPIEVILHVFDGKLDEVEIFKADGRPIKKTLSANDFDVLVMVPRKKYPPVVD